jgi:biotin operon repressor
METEKILSKQHIQLPNDMGKSGLTANDLLVYVSIKRHMNNITKECFPSQVLVAEHSGLSRPTIQKSIEQLKKFKYLEVRKDGRKNVYKFNSYKNFEPFSYDFLDNKELSSGEKAYIMITQQYMFKDEEGLGKVSYSNAELGKKINMSHDTIARYDKGLAQKGFLTLVKTKNRSIEEGHIMINEKLFHLDELGQAVIWTLQNHEDRLQTQEKTISLLLKAVEESNERERERDKILASNGIDMSKLFNVEMMVI